MQILQCLQCPLGVPELLPNFGWENRVFVQIQLDVILNTPNSRPSHRLRYLALPHPHPDARTISRGAKQEPKRSSSLKSSQAKDRVRKAA
jgi:hypothetical protein